MLWLMLRALISVRLDGGEEVVDGLDCNFVGLGIRQLD